MEKKTQNAIALLRATRKNIQGIYNNYNFDQLNSVPAGFNNNLLWNAGHVIATMELLTYGLTGLPLPSDKEFIGRYRKGSKPEPPCPEGDYGLIGEGLSKSVDRLVSDLETLDFSNFKEYTTSYGVTLSSIEDALTFNNMHEAMHLGTMLAMKRLV
ncbi:DinB family protein [Neolewinella persica]|uniref:DinB family protein n=1 Tax=Neolewinella persica TaxID=70998 RepID=UPI000366B7B8|nr:DinB family protein [Neolewinella persica]